MLSDIREGIKAVGKFSGVLCYSFEWNNVNNMVGCFGIKRYAFKLLNMNYRKILIIKD